MRGNGVHDDSTHGLIILEVQGDKPVIMKWAGPHDLSLSCESCTQQEVDFEAIKCSDILIRYAGGLAIKRDVGE
jgi:hypothetical protein